jgi:hypothetical protein
MTSHPVSLEIGDDDDDDDDDNDDDDDESNNNIVSPSNYFAPE